MIPSKVRRLFVKKQKVLALKKITLKDLDQSKLDQAAGGHTGTACTLCPTAYKTCFGVTCPDVC
jgi:hypothetical protein